MTYSNIVVSLSATALTAATYIYKGQWDYAYLGLVFFATLFVYSYARFFEGQSEDFENSEITKWHKNHRSWIWFVMIFSVLSSCVLAYLSLSPEQWATGFILAAVSLAYPLGLKFKGMQTTIKPLRERPGIKLFAIAAVWTFVSVVFPLWDSLSWRDVGLVFSRMFFIVAITIPFDIRDYHEDAREMWTLPRIWGRKKAWQMALAFGALSAFSLLGYGVQEELSFTLIIGELVGHVYAFSLVLKSPKQKEDLYFSFWLEISPIILFSCLYLFSYI